MSLPIPTRLFTATMLTGLALSLAGCLGARPRTADATLERYEFEQPQMGVPFRIVLYATNAAQAERAAGAAFERISELNAIMSDYETDSELNALSRTSGQGQAVPVSRDLWDVLERSQRLAALTGGAFDITAGPAVSLWRRARRTQQLPDPERLAEALGAVGYRKMALRPDDRTVELLAPRMKLDLGGIAKGYAVDEALSVLRRHGVTRALVAGSGDIAAGDPPPGKRGWQISIVPFDAPVSNVPPVVLWRAAVSTSGDAAQRLEIDGRRYSHIVDPRTGIGLTDHSLVTVIARDATTTDSLATAISVLGPVEGLKLAERFRSVEVRIMRQPGKEVEVIESPGFKRHYEPSARGKGRSGSGGQRVR